jgi:alpha-mannosidase
MTEKKLHMIGNAHLDPVWLWRWQEGFQEVKATFRSALDRLKEYEKFVFTSSSAACYEWVENNDPQMFAEIQERVREGRWKIVGGWWIQPDCNVPSGESFVRQGLYAQRYFEEKLGVTATVGYNVDSFGHHAMLPQILAKSGMDYYVFMRPAPHEKGLPARTFWWESDDGSRVLTHRISFSYHSSDGDLEQYVRRCLGELKEPFTELMCFYGVGNHGGGPTKANIESIKELNERPEMPELVFSSPEQFFKRIEKSGLTLPVIHDDLQHHAIGCYSAHSGVKLWNRRSEDLLVTAEKLSAVAERATGQPYPDDYDRAWKAVLFNQFHDILAGTSIESAYEDARDLYGEANSIAARNLNYALQSLSWNVNIEEEEGTKPIFVFNPHSWGGKMPVELEFGELDGSEVLLGERDERVPMQTVRSEAAARRRNRICFVADLPPMGYQVYRVAPRPGAEEQAPVEAGDTWAQNGRFRLEIDPETGFLARLYDRKKSFEVLGGVARPVVLDDPSDTWSHNEFRYDREVGVFTAENVRLAEHGPVKAVIRVESVFGSSWLTQEFSVYRDIERIDVAVTVDWREKLKVLKLRFPANLDFVRATYEVPYGTIQREANGEEQPGLGWLDLSGVGRDGGEPYGLSLINDGKYGFDVINKEMGMTVLRSPAYAHHGPFVLPPDGGGYSFTDQGIQRFTYSLLPHANGWEEAGTALHAAEVNARPVAVVETYHDGPLPQKGSYLSVSVENVVVSALKKAEDGDRLIVRCHETAKKTTRATISLKEWGREIEAEFGPHEIKTFKVPAEEGAPVIETDLIEWETA